MKPLKIRLQEARKKFGTIQWQTIERDYLLSWILAGIGRNEALQKTLAFKGGTALKKCYFGEYRFSQDLDFSGPEDFFKETMLSHVEKTWEHWLGPLVKNLPSFDAVITELRPQVSALLKKIR